MHFQPCKVVDNSVKDSPCLRTQPSLFCHWGHLHVRNEQPALAFTCTFYYHACMYTHTISHDGWFFMLFRHEFPHVTYRKLITGISNELTFQRERTIAWLIERYLRHFDCTLPSNSGFLAFVSVHSNCCFLKDFGSIATNAKNESQTSRTRSSV